MSKNQDPSAPLPFYTSVAEDAIKNLKDNILSWADRYEFCAVYDSNGMKPACGYATYELLAAVSSEKINKLKEGQVFRDLNASGGQWQFGYLAYDLKNETEALTSSHAAHVPAADACFFVPEHVIMLYPNGQLIIESREAQQIWKDIQNAVVEPGEAFRLEAPLESMSRENYVSQVRTIIDHIEEGDVYELNFCQEFKGRVRSGNPLATYKTLNGKSPMPFSAYLKMKELYVLCASPERFIRKEGKQLVSQPIKGTISREQDPVKDKAQKEALITSEKERAENLMIVDLVRNDLARSCRPGSVKVEELFGIYGFRNIYQMISTVSGELEAHSPVDALKNAFPMGSMTGAPKVMAMKLIEQYESSRRGIYSGAVGYIHPNGDFDFNVLIRSIIFDKNSRNLSFHAGGAITYDSDPLAEYEECMLKTEVIRQVLNA